MARRLRVCIDWDGTLVKQEWPKKTTEWMPGAVDALRAINKYAQIVIYTSRVAPAELDEITPRPVAEVEAEIDYIKNMLASAGIRDAIVWDHRIWPWKPPADAYVDDKAVHYAKRPHSWKNLTRKLAVMCGQDYVEDEYE